MLKAAVAGLGAISPVHLDILSHSRDVTLAAVCDCKPEKRNTVEGVAFYTDVERMLEQEKPDVLHICLPHHLHAPVAAMAARRGIHVFMEKPPALCCEELQILYGLEERYGVKIGLCLQNRYNQTTQTLRRALQEDHAGPLRGCKAVLTWNRTPAYYANDPWRGKTAQAGGGVMLSQAIHLLDLMTWFCGTPAAVRGTVGNLVHSDIEVEDTAMAQIEFPDGVTGIFYGSVGYSRDADVELELDCGQTVYRICDKKLWRISAAGQELLAEDTPIHSGKAYYGSGHREAIHRFYQAVRTGSRDYITLQDAAACMKLIDGITASSRQAAKIFITGKDTE